MRVTTNWYQQKWARVFSHVLFIALSYIVLLQVFKSNVAVTVVDHVYTALFLVSLLPVVYFNLEWLLPKLGKKERLIEYGVLLIAAIIVFSWINIQFFDNWSARLLPQFYFISYFNWWEVMAIFAGFVVLTTLIKLSRSWFVLKDLQQQLLVLEKERVDMELAALQAQVNPHFFFNTLNSIYSLSLDNDSRLPETILQLSQIMRYYLYESKGEKVPLEKEIAILKDYIQLQRIRSNEKLDLQLEMEGVVEGKEIAPLLLLTVTENAFKHGAKGDAGASYIHIKTEVKDDSFQFQISNNKGKAHADLDTGKGLGLENLRRRLELLYPQKHELAIRETATDFTVELKLQL
ncbi:MAG: sensor histidine kinase [Flavisolibacter sp.]